MDLGLNGKWALVCGGSQGLGLGCAQALAQEGVNLVLSARTAATLDQAADHLRRDHGVEVRTVAADLLTAEGRMSAISAAPQVDILVNNIGGPPPGDYRSVSREQWISAFDATLFMPLEMIKAVIDGMVERGFGRVVNITAGLIKMPMDQAAIANSRLVLTGVVSSIARAAVTHNVTINNLLPGTYDTGRIAQQAKAMGVEPDVLLQRVLAMVPAKRLGTPDEFGHACAFLCSVRNGYITRQNILMDGGAFPGIL